MVVCGPGCRASRRSSGQGQPAEVRKEWSSRTRAPADLGIRFFWSRDHAPMESRAFWNQTIRPHSRPMHSKICKAAPVPSTNHAPVPEPAFGAAVRGTAKSAEVVTSRAAPAARRTLSAQPAKADSRSIRCPITPRQPLSSLKLRRRGPRCARAPASRSDDVDILIMHNGEKPGAKVGTVLPIVLFGNRADQGILNEATQHTRRHRCRGRRCRAILGSTERTRRGAVPT